MGNSPRTADRTHGGRAARAALRLAVPGLMALLAVAGCGAAVVPGVPVAEPGLEVGAGSTAPAAGPGSGIFSGDLSVVPGQIAARLGCTDLNTDPQIDRYANSQAECLLDGDNAVVILSFGSAADEQAWFALGRQNASEYGDVVLGDGWAVEPTNSGQLETIQQVLGGEIRQQP